MQIEIINIGEVVSVYNRHGELKGAGTIVRHINRNYSHVVRMDSVNSEVYPRDYVVGGEYTYEAPSLSYKNHLRGGQRTIVQVEDIPFDAENPF